jgi:uncharacterized protein (TIGR02145 family)
MKKVNLIFVVLSSIFTVVGYSQNIKPIKEVKIGKQIWMAENLNVDKFLNGETIPEAKTEEEWKKAGEEGKPAWCYNNNDPKNGKIYGKLYNWYAVNDPRGLAPKGWKIPSDNDWLIMINFLGGESVAGKKLKSTNLWSAFDEKNGNGTNESGFSGLPGGGCLFKGTFFDIGQFAYWWNSSELTHGLSNSDDSINNGFNSDPSAGYSVRCIK